MTGVATRTRVLLTQPPVPAVAADLALVAALLATSLWLDATALGLTATAGPFPGKQAVEYGSPGQWHAALIVWWAATALACAAVLARRRLPVLAFLAAGLAAAAHLSDPRIGATPVDLAAPLTLYAAVPATRGRRAALLLLAAGLGACVAAALIGQATLGAGFGGGLALFSWPKAAGRVLVPGLVLTAAWLAGDAVRARQGHLAVLRQHARDLERDRDQQAALAAAAERGRITREVHDVVAHALSVMVVQAQAATVVLHREPDTASTVLADAITVGRESLAEMRRLLGAIRAQPGDDASLVPQPGLASLPALSDQVSRAGVAVCLDIPADLPVLPATIDLSAYRIVQEALTNTIKHAGPGASATVRVSQRGAALHIDVTDTGGRAEAGPCAGAEAGAGVRGGNGLRGIAERVAILGGQMQAGKLPDGGFQVTAELALEAP
jgi:signal transduction histidine kinase